MFPFRQTDFHNKLLFNELLISFWFYDISWHHYIIMMPTPLDSATGSFAARHRIRYNAWCVAIIPLLPFITGYCRNSPLPLSSSTASLPWRFIVLYNRIARHSTTLTKYPLDIVLIIENIYIHPNSLLSLCYRPVYILSQISAPGR